MTVGVFAMALVLILSGSLKETIRDTLEKNFGYNIQVQTRTDQQQQELEKAFDSKTIPGLEKYLSAPVARVRWTGANGVSAEELVQKALEKKTQTQTSGFGGSSNVPDMSGLVGIKTSDITGFVNLVSGQFATTDDQITISKNVAEAYDLKAGDKLTYIDLVQNKELTVTVTGIVENKNFIVSIGSAQTTLNRIQQIPGHLDIYNLTVSRDKVTEAESYLQKNFAGADVTNLSFITNVINKILDNVTAFPLLLGFLCLIAGAVLIANNVALAVLERRTEMGVMKSLGADDGRVLSIINYESSILGLVGGLFGLVYAILLALFAVQAFGTAENPATLAISPWLLLGMLALSLGLAIGATMFSAWGAAREKPMVVLRYE
jgi:ABC-type antimicrobial peptide transport system permease subunit